jgi:cell division protein ZapA
MASIVSVSIVGRAYELNCDPGQEDYLRSLAEDVDGRATELLKLVGQVGDARLLVMVALSMADEMVDLKRTVDRQSEVPEAAPSTLSEPAIPSETADSLLAGGIEALARRIEAIADHLEKA